MKRKGFTLIELLIVVAIIAILAAIAVPNFLEAQTRAKVSRVKNDMRAIGTAIELYAVDHNRTPTVIAGYHTAPGVSSADLRNGPSLVNAGLPGNNYHSYRFWRMTSPIAYISSIPQDAFSGKGVKDVSGQLSTSYDNFDYVDEYHDRDFLQASGSTGNNALSGRCNGAKWRLVSAGPDRIMAYGGGMASSNATINRHGVDYDATNGTISVGEIVRTGGQGALPGSKSLWPAIDRVRNTYNGSWWF